MQQFPTLTCGSFVQNAQNKAIYTTNSVESLNRSLRKIIKTRGGFPNEEAALKLLFLALRQAAKKWTMPIHHWREALNHFTILWPERMTGPGKSRAMTTRNVATSMGRGRGTLPLHLDALRVPQDDNEVRGLTPVRSGRVFLCLTEDDKLITGYFA